MKDNSGPLLLAALAGGFVRGLSDEGYIAQLEAAVNAWRAAVEDQYAETVNERKAKERAEAALNATDAELQKSRATERQTLEQLLKTAQELSAVRHREKRAAKKSDSEIRALKAEIASIKNGLSGPN